MKILLSLIFILATGAGSLHAQDTKTVYLVEGDTLFWRLQNF